MRSSQKIRQTLARYLRKPNPQQGILGNAVGEISVPNRVDYVYVRVAGLGTIAVYNKRVPLILDLPVDVGYDPLEPKNFQVLNIHRYPQGGGRGLVDVATILHGKTHNWAGIDPVYIEKRQLMPLRPTPMGGMQVYVTREVTYYDDKFVVVTGQQLDMASYVPATGSRLALIYKDTDELIKVRNDGAVKDLFTLTLNDAPQAYPGTVPIALIRLYGGQSGVAEGYSDTDLIDVRQLFSPIFPSGTYSGTTGTGGTGGGHVIQDEGVSRPQRTNLNFKGALVWANDNAGADSTDIIISGSSLAASTGTVLIDHDHLEYPATPTTTTITTGGYSTDDVNALVHRYSAIASIELNGMVYQAAGFWDVDGHLAIAVRTVPEAWTIRDISTITVSGGDDHDNVAIGIDPSGYIHVCYDMHAEPLKYRKSNLPINSWTGTLTNTLSMLGTNESTVTYPNFINDPSGKLYFIFRCGGEATNTTIYFYAYDEVAGTWAAAAGTSTAGLIISGSGSKGQYLGRPCFDANFGSGGRLHLAWVWTAASGYVNPAYLAWNGTTFENADGTARTVPITTVGGYDLIDSEDTNYAQFPNVFSDSSGYPHVVYGKKKTADGYHHLYHAWHNGATWTIAQITTTNLNHTTTHLWPLILIDRRTNIVYILYRDPLDATDADGLLMQASAPGDYTAWTKSVLYAGDIGLYSTAAYAMPKPDYYQWEHYIRMSLSLEIYEAGQTNLPIYLLEYFPAGWGVRDATNWPGLHTNDTDVVNGIHHTLGTGTYQALPGNTKLDDLAAPDDNTDLNASTGTHGLLPKLGGGTTNFLRADGSWQVPPAGGVDAFIDLSDTFAAYTGLGGQFVRVKASEDGLETGFSAGTGTSGSVATDEIWDAAGDLAVGTGANTAARKAIGTAYQVLRVNAAAGDLEWVGGKTLLAEIVVSAGGGAASIDFTSIPATFRHLVLDAVVRGTKNAAYDNLNITVNADGGSNYDFVQANFYQTTHAISESIGQTSWATVTQPPAATATAGLFNLIHIVIPYYANTNWRKSAIAHITESTAESSGGIAIRNLALHWRSAAAINEITLTFAGGNVAQNSIASLYGIS